MMRDSFDPVSSLMGRLADEIVQLKKDVFRLKQDNVKLTERISSLERKSIGAADDSRLASQYRSK
jgi:hypothetical protein